MKTIKNHKIYNSKKIKIKVKKNISVFTIET